MLYNKTIIVAECGQEELVNFLLFENGAGGVSSFKKSDFDLRQNSGDFDYADENFRPDYEQERLFKEYGEDKCFISAFLESEKAVENFKFMAKEIGLTVTVLNEVSDDREWKDEWKKYYNPFTVGELWIVPTWRVKEIKSDKKIVIDPGISFGTGQHATTRLILEEMQEFDFKGKSVLDLGCGSGILGIAALLLKAKNCTFADIDERAVKIAEENCKTSKVISKADFDCCNFKNNGRVYDIVLANLTATIFTELFEEIKKSVNKNGIIFVSGIINDKIDDTEKLFAEDFKLIKKLKENDWYCLIYTRN